MSVLSVLYMTVVENGKVYTFGDGNNGQLGLGTMTLETSKPKLVKMGSAVSHIFCGENFTALISGEKTLQVVVRVEGKSNEG